jgi:hypothetical protein
MVSGSRLAVRPLQTQVSCLSARGFTLEQPRHHQTLLVHHALQVCAKLELTQWLFTPQRPDEIVRAEGTGV